MTQHTRQPDAFPQKRLTAKGFTVVELLVVLGILGILAAVVVLAVGDIQDRRDTEACDTQISTAETAAAAAFVDSTADPRVYPTAAELDDLLSDELPPEYVYTQADGQVIKTGGC